LNITEDWKHRARDVMEYRGISNRELSARAGLGETTARGILNSETDSRLGTIGNIAAALGVAPQWLIFGIGKSGLKEFEKGHK
jgi:transcriptional regulator with XRE-family HTH domain